MTSNFKTNGGDLDDVFIDDPWIIERYVGNQLWTWGNNYRGRLGDNTNTHSSSPVQTVSGGTNWKQVSVGTQNTGAIKTDGTLWMWGRNGNGTLGDNTIVHRSSPVQTVAGGTNWKFLSLGDDTTGAIKTDGTLWLWGANTSGELGVNDTVHRSSPVQTVAGGTNWKYVSCGINHTAAIKTDGTLWTWGYAGPDGRLGDNTTVHKSSPVQTVAGGTNWKYVACSQHTAAIKTDGTLWGWGTNTHGQLGVEDITHRSSPVQTVSGGNNWKQARVGSYTVVAIKTDGTLWNWGRNEQGQLGDETVIAKSSPIQTVAGGNNWKKVGIGGNGSVCAAIKTDGTLWMWGKNTTFGQLGDNTLVSKSSPVQTVASGNNWKDVSVAGDASAAITYTEA